MRLMFAIFLLLSTPVRADEAQPPTTDESPSATAPRQGPSPGLAGVWSLDADASDAPDALLAALGRSAMERAVARKIKKVTQTVTIGDGWIEVETANAFRTATTRTELGQAASVDLFGQPMKLMAKSVDGRVVADGTVDLAGGPAAFSSARELSDPDTMTLSMKLAPASGETVTIRRVFRRAK